jgi:hypothetical protein
MTSETCWSGFLGTMHHALVTAPKVNGGYQASAHRQIRETGMLGPGHQ